MGHSEGGGSASWHHAIGNATYADAILDRLVHNAYRIELNGDSMRRQTNPPGLTAAPPDDTHYHHNPVISADRDRWNSHGHNRTVH